MWFKVTIVILIYFYCVVAAFRPRVDKISPYSRATPGYRLPQNVELYLQTVIMEPFLNNFTFQGLDIINGKITQDANQIILHSKDLDIINYSLILNKENITDFIELSFDLEKDFLIFNLDRVATVDSEFEIAFVFSGLLNENNKGFYRASYIDENGESVWFATTQFQATHARRAFPCFDEPSFKVALLMTIMREPQYISIANAPLGISVDGPNGYILDSYLLTQYQSTYLFGFMVSNYQNVTNGRNGVYAKPQAIADGRGDYALAMSESVLSTMEQFTNITYRMQKIDQVAIPDNYFTFGAMENWGIVMYRERLLLFKEGVSSTQEKQDVATIISHEYTHQWFGNLVTPSWWSYLWLNEGFATYFESYLVSLIEPSWRLMDQFVFDFVQYVLYLDSLDVTRPMTFDAGTPDEIDNLFDDIAYEKSGAVLRMMRHFLTEDVFQKGLQLYLMANQYQSVSEDDLYLYLQIAADEVGIQLEFPLANIMFTWSLQNGYPVITVQRNTDGSITLTQERFLLNSEPTTDQIWYIPVNFATETNPDFDNTTPSFWLTTKTNTTNLGLGSTEWILLNKQQTGYYRVNYDLESWDLIINYLRSENYQNIHLLNRAYLVDDAFNLARSGKIPYEKLFELISFVGLTTETDYIVISSLLKGLNYLNNMLADSPSHGLFTSFVTQLLQNTYNTVGTELLQTDTNTVIFNRINILNWMCRLEYPDCLVKMNEKLRTWSYIQPDLQSPVYCGGLRSGGLEEWQYLNDLFNSTTIEPYNKNRVGASLGCTTNTEQLLGLLDISLSKGDYSLFSSVYSGSKVGLELAFDYFINNFDNFKTRFSREIIAAILTNLSERVGTSSHLDKFNAFINSLDAATLQEFLYNISAAKSNIERNVQWFTNYEPVVNQWLTQNVGIAF